MGRHDSIEDLVKTITERKVEALSYSSFSDLAEYFLDKFHITLVPQTKRPLVINAIETRNISVHNRCIVNQRFVSRTGGKLETVGQLRVLKFPEVHDSPAVGGIGQNCRQRCEKAATPKRTSLRKDRKCRDGKSWHSTTRSRRRATKSRGRWLSLASI